MNWLNQHKRVLSIVALTIIIAGSFFFYTIHNVNATKQSNPPPTTPNAEALADLNVAEEGSNSPKSISPTQQKPAPASKADNETTLVSELSETAQKYLHAGWLHFVKENASDTDRGSKGALENGAVLSANTIWDCWLHLDDALQISDSVCIQKNPNGSVIQVGVRSGDLSWNSATDEVTHNEDSHPQYIADIDALQNQVTKNHASLAAEEVTEEKGERRYQLSYTITESSPILLWDYNSPVTGSQYIYTFDPETGMMLRSQQWITFEDGSQRVIEQVVVQIFEIVEKPAGEIANYLSQLENQQ